jgi:hypothetical protein
MGETVDYSNIPKYPYNKKNYIKDYVYWDGYGWSRHKEYILDDSIPITKRPSDNIMISLDSDNQVDLPTQFERPDLIKLGVHTLPVSKEETYRIYKRRMDDKIIVVDDPAKLKKPYVRLGTFTVSGRVPANCKKMKKQIRAFAYGQIGADAVIVERWEVLPFKQEDYWPITTFQEPEYVRYYCIAVAFEESAEIPEEVKQKYAVDQEEVNRRYQKMMQGIPPTVQ